MERRNSKREPARVNIVLSHNGLPIVSGTTRNIGAGGMFLEKPATRLNPDDRVGLDVCFDHDGQVNHYRLSATVVHKRIDGIGLMFYAFNEVLLERVRFSMPVFEMFALQRQAQSFFKSHSPPSPWG